MQDDVWSITLIGVGLVALVFVVVLVHAGRPPLPETAQKKAHAIQLWWFLALLGLGSVMAFRTLRPFPIAAQHVQSRGAQIVSATGHQWAWELSRNRVDAGTPVEFDVTGADVNHGFAIYGPEDRILTQTQAMPGYTNRLLYTFTRPGKYRVMCLEYCGLGHHSMVAEFEVVAAHTEGQP